MDGEQQKQHKNIEQSEIELLIMNPSSPYAGTHSHCGACDKGLQPIWVAAKPSTPWWGTLLVCMLACLMTTVIVGLVLYFVHFGKTIPNTSITVHIDGKSGTVTCTSDSTLGPVSTTVSSLYPTTAMAMQPSTSVTKESNPTVITTGSITDTIEVTTPFHRVIIEDEDY
ncbi:uncharacterized protein ACOB8E_009326 [Sarcophilus harrisii]